MSDRSLPPQIDPRVHYLYQVDVEVRYTTYVVGRSGLEAEEVAEAHFTEDAQVALHGYRVRRLHVPPAGGDGGVIPWGPTHVGPEQLTAREVVLYLRDGVSARRRSRVVRIPAAAPGDPPAPRRSEIALQLYPRVLQGGCAWDGGRLRGDYPDEEE